MYYKAMMSGLPLLFAVVVVLYVGFCNADKERFCVDRMKPDQSANNLLSDQALNRADADIHVKRNLSVGNWGSEDGGFRGVLPFKDKVKELLDLIKLLNEWKKQDQGNSRRTFGFINGRQRRKR